MWNFKGSCKHMEPNKFKKRAGTTDFGKKYEDLNLARLVLKLVIDDTVDDFTISSNDEKFGDFDDIVIELKSDKSFTKTAIQIKYSNEGKTLPVSSFWCEKGDFSLKKYLRSYKQIKQYKLILFTNRKLDLAHENSFNFENISLRIVQEQVDQLVNSAKHDGRCYKFEANEASDSNLEILGFFENFRIFTNQSSVSVIEKMTLDEFQKIFHCPSEHFHTYLQFITRWSLLEGNKEKLGKELMKRAIALNVLSPFIQPLVPSLIDEKMILLRKTIAKFQVTVFRKKSYDKIKGLWGDFYQKLGQNNNDNKIKSRFQLDQDDSFGSKMLWLKSDAPLIVVESVTTSRIIQMCNDWFIVLGNGPILPQNRTVFRHLADLNQGSEMYKLTCCVQGKEQQLFETFFDNEMRQVVTTDDLLQLLSQEVYSFGGKQETLPVPYIERFLTGHVIRFEHLHKMDSLVVINCGKKLETITKRNKIKSLLRGLNAINGSDYLKDTCYHKSDCDLLKPKLFLFEDKCSQQDFDKIRELNKYETIHHFSVVEDDEHLEWLKSNKNATDLKEFLIKSVTINESLIFDKSGVNLIIGEPGIGKTIFVKNLKKHNSPNIWSVILSPSVFQNPFNRHTFEEVILAQTHTNLDRKILQILMKKNRVVYIVDSWDQISLEQLTCICDFFRTEELPLWVTSRPHLQNFFETKLNVLSRTLLPFSDVQKKSYICKRLEEKYPDIGTEVLKIETYINQEILNNPLHIYMLTEVFSLDDDKFSQLSADLFNVCDLYEYWVEQKFALYYNQKFGVWANDRVFEEHKNYLKRDYQLAALHRNAEFLEKVKIEGDPIGIIEVTDDQSPKFFHPSIAEYFIASHLAKNFAQVSSDFIFKEENRNVRYFFDLLLAQNSKPHMAVFYRNLDVLKKIQNLDKFVDSGGRNVLHLACSWGQTYPNFDVETQEQDWIYLVTPKETSEVLREDPNYKEMIVYLVEKLDLWQRDTLFNYTALQYAEASNCLYTKMIILRKMNKTIDLDTPMASLLYYAAEFGYEDVFNLYETFPLIKLKDQSFLHLCVQHEHFLAQLLAIESYHKMIDFAPNGETALHKCCKEGYYKSALLLRQNGASCVTTTSDGWTPLHFASLNGHESIVTLLKDVDVNTATNKGYTALHLACYKGYTTIVTLLLDLGANIYGNTNVTPLLLACQNGQEDVARCLLQLGALVTTSNSWTPLHSACYKGHESIVKLLIDFGASVTTVDGKNVTPLHLACHEGHETIVELLLNLRANVDARDSVGFTPLHLACHRNFEQIAKLLIAFGASCDVSDDMGLTPLHWACQEGRDQIVELLLASGANLETVTKTGKTPFHFACLKGHEAVVRLLMPLVNPQIATTRNFTPLHLACQEGHENVVELLLQTGVNSVTQDGSTPLHWASHNGHYNIVKMLLQSGAKVEIRDSEGSTPLLLACYQGFDKIAKLLIHFGANITTSNNRGFTPLHWASQQNHPNLVKVLIELGAKVTIGTQQGFTPLHLACQKGHISVVKRLIVSGANIEDVTNKGWTPLHWASFKGHETVTNLLLGADANVNIPNGEGMTPLHLACSKGFVQIANTLIEFGASTECENCDGLSPLYLACQGGHLEVVKLLIMFGVSTKGGEVEIAQENGFCDIRRLLEEKEGREVGKYRCVIL
nr:PREDICTED: uncharacterized protein LOC103315105 isoform X2 [Tribolium castaneum]|eukprot:XP_015840073.1 PREDICTED: uncharacterized protein LOC103315105 isoform X2 [Tribolium castaneum]